MPALHRSGARFPRMDWRQAVSFEHSGTSDAYLSALKRCAGVHILVIGDVMLDEYVRGTVDRISPEAPIPILHAAETQFKLGGAANVAQQLIALGASVTLVGVTGQDSAGLMLRKLCESSGISTEWLLQIDSRQTSRKIRILSQGQQLLRVDWEDRQAVTEADSNRLVAHINACRRVDAAIFSDYAKGVVTPELINHLRSTQPSLQHVVVDPKHRNFGRYRGATVLTPNLRELSEAVGHSLNDANLSEIGDAARTQISLGGFDAITVTLGDRGMLVVPADGTETLIPALKRAVYDVTGAGDTAAAVITACLSTGASIATAAYVGNAAAGVAVGAIGAVAVATQDIAQALSNGTPSKILGLSELKQKVQLWRGEKKSVVLTNGCFDLLHPGHLQLLSFAKNLGDVLVLAINSDAAVRRLKGPNRPVVSETDRAAMLGALQCVDAVVLFDEDTPLETIRAVVPDILVKGQDYRLDEVVGRNIVEGAGGWVVLAPLLPNYSTTSILARARA